MMQVEENLSLALSGTMTCIPFVPFSLVEINSCYNNTRCGRHGQCKNLIFKYQCLCNFMYTGEFCNQCKFKVLFFQRHTDDIACPEGIEAHLSLTSTPNVECIAVLVGDIFHLLTKKKLCPIISSSPSSIEYTVVTLICHMCIER